MSHRRRTNSAGFQLKDQYDKEVKLSDFAGKKMLLMFYPLDWSPVVHQRACLLRRQRHEKSLKHRCRSSGRQRGQRLVAEAYAEKWASSIPCWLIFSPARDGRQVRRVSPGKREPLARHIVIVNKGGKVALVANYDIPLCQTSPK
jgi:hypothetical protein